MCVHHTSTILELKYSNLVSLRDEVKFGISSLFMECHSNQVKHSMKKAVRRETTSLADPLEGDSVNSHESRAFEEIANRREERSERDRRRRRTRTQSPAIREVDGMNDCTPRALQHTTLSRAKCPYVRPIQWCTDRSLLGLVFSWYSSAWLKSDLLKGTMTRT